MTSFEEFRLLVSHGNVIPVYETVLADTETPVSVYLKIRDESPYSFLLESVEGGEKIGRYSFIGFDPFMLFQVRENTYRMQPRHDDVANLPALANADDHPLTALKKIFAHIRTVHIPGLPRLTGGAIGYIGYESIRLVEDVPTPSVDELNIPDVFLMFCDTVLIFDNVKHEMFIVSNAYVPDSAAAETTLRTEFEKAIQDIARIKKLLRKNVDTSLEPFRPAGPWESVTPKEQYEASVDRAREYIRAGDIFQVVLSQRIKRVAAADSFAVYRRLRQINPSPYMYFLRINDIDVIGASPEMLVRVENGVVETRPIAGTRRRGLTQEEDLRLERELLADEKERAEHLMLVDLGRNDVGRISAFGSVQVTEFMAVEKYSHVMHLVSNVQGKLREDVTPIDALISCFPAGTLSGAPKIRAMEIIAELEPVRRGIYGGAIGYIDFSGNIDSCIGIRTIVRRQNEFHFQAGAGIVFDSIASREYEETREKLNANLQACESLIPPGRE